MDSLYTHLLPEGLHRQGPIRHQVDSYRQTSIQCCNQGTDPWHLAATPHCPRSFMVFFHHFFKASEILFYCLPSVLAKQEARAAPNGPPGGSYCSVTVTFVVASPSRFKDDGTRMLNDRSFHRSPAYPLILNFIDDFGVPLDFSRMG